MVRPSPVPPNRRVIDESTCSKALKTRENLSLGMPMPVSFTEKCSTTRPAAVELPFTYDARTRDLLASYRERRIKEELALPSWEAPTGKKRRGTFG